MLFIYIIFQIIFFIFARLKKRTLRSKVKKAIDEIPCECNKLEKYQMKIKDLEERYKSLENQKYLVLLENEKEFKKKNFYHSKPNHNQYFPNLKEIKKAETQTNFHLKHRTNMVQEICKHLNKNEMLEVEKQKVNMFYILDRGRSWLFHCYGKTMLS